MIYKYWIVTADQDCGTLFTHSEKEANDCLVEGKRVGMYRMDAMLIEVIDELVLDEDIISID
jgi:hypothetical protein